MKTEFTSAFQMSKKIIFEVRSSSLRGNRNPYFATSAEEFNQPKTDYKRCGQCQPDLLLKFPTAMNFFRKWDEKHLSDLSEEEYSEMRDDLSELQRKYNHIMIEAVNGEAVRDLRFSELKDLSKMTPKKGA